MFFVCTLKYSACGNLSYQSGLFRYDIKPGNVLWEIKSENSYWSQLLAKSWLQTGPQLLALPLAQNRYWLKFLSGIQGFPQSSDTCLERPEQIVTRVGFYSGGGAAKEVNQLPAPATGTRRICQRCMRWDVKHIASTSTPSSCGVKSLRGLRVAHGGLGRWWITSGREHWWGYNVKWKMLGGEPICTTPHNPTFFSMNIKWYGGGFSFTLSIAALQSWCPGFNCGPPHPTPPHPSIECF